VRLETTIAATPAACFELSLSVDAHTASMNGSGEQAVDGVTSGQMTLGDTVTWRARHFGIAFGMTSVISALERPHRFVDEQLRGPFGSWWHEHAFSELDHGGTLMVDVVQFRTPLGLFGSMAERLVLNAYMTRLLRQRNDWLKRTLENATTP